MKQFTLAIFFLLSPFLLTAQCVYISEYIEGAGNDKCIEIYNGTGAPLDLAAGGYAIRMYSNGAATPGATILLTGTVAPGDVFVVCNPAAGAAFLAQADLQSGSITFNGNDAVELINSLGTLDVVGQIGVDPGPGTEWAGLACTAGTQNGRLIRKPGLTCPSFNGASAFNPDTEWDCSATTNADSLGGHTTGICALSGLALAKSCNNGVGAAQLSFNTSGAVSTQFTLTVTPDPGGLSGTYNYSSLPLSLSGFTGDSLTGYQFVVANVGGSCLSATLSDQRFDCPVADALSFSYLTPGCVDTTDVFQLVVCAVESGSGKTQPDFTGTITLNLDLGFTGTLVGNTSQAAANGCATFNLLYDTGETVAFTATSPGLFAAGSGPFTVVDDCPGVIMKTGVINPCGNESQNEFIAATTGGAALSVGDIELYSLDHTSGVQPNVNHTWSGSGTSVGPSTTETCGVGLECYRWLDINIPGDATTITSLVNQLNVQANCGFDLFVAPVGPNLGTIPPNSYVIFFLGAGGNPGTIAPGFDGLGTNLDFDSFCGLGSIYVVFGEHGNNLVGAGFLSNTAARTIEISTAGTTTSSVAYPAPALSAEPELVDEFGNYTVGDSCTPATLFGPVLLEVTQETDNLAEVMLLSARAYPNPAADQLTVELPFSGPGTVQGKIYSMDGKSVDLRTLDLPEGNHQLIISVAPLPAGVYVLHLVTAHGAFRVPFIRSQE